MCLACSAEIVEGEVTQPAARGLTDEEAGVRTHLHGAPAVRSEARSRQVPAEHRDDAATDASDVDGAAADDD